MRNRLRHKNRLEKLIQAEIKKQCKPGWSSLWGQKCWITPALVNTGRGDKAQLVWVQSLDCRPDFYVLRIDSNEDIDADDYRWDELLLCPIEELYDNVDRYEGFIDEKGKWMGRYIYDEDEDESPVELKWPMLSWGGGSWGVIKNFKPPIPIHHE